MHTYKDSQRKQVFKNNINSDHFTTIYAYDSVFSFYVKNFLMKRLFFLCIFVITVYHVGFTQSVDVPLITDNAGNMIKRDFENTMSNLPENHLDNIHDIFTFGIGHFHNGLWGFMSGGIHFARLADSLYLPLFFGLATNDASDYGYASFYGGGGILIRNQYFNLGLIGGLLGTYAITDDSYLVFFGDDYKYNFDYGIYPSLNTSKYPFLRYLETIRGYLVPNDPAAEIDSIKYFGYGLEFIFKGLLGLPIFDLYTDSGINKFMFGYDFSSFPMVLESTGKAGGNTLSYGSSINNIGSIYRTVSYGMRIGFWDLTKTGHHIFDINYLMLNDTFGYDYPYNLNGFPSLTYTIIGYNDGGAYFHGETITYALFTRFSTINFSGLPYIPDLGMWVQVGGVTSINIMYSYPTTFTFSMRMSFKYGWSYSKILQDSIRRRKW